MTLGSVSFHLHDLAKSGHVSGDSNFDLMDGSLAVGELDLSLTWCYGAYGYGYSALLCGTDDQRTSSHQTSSAAAPEASVARCLYPRPAGLAPETLDPRTRTVTAPASAPTRTLTSLLPSSRGGVSAAALGAAGLLGTQQQPPAYAEGAAVVRRRRVSWNPAPEAAVVAHGELVAATTEAHAARQEAFRHAGTSIAGQQVASNRAARIAALRSVVESCEPVSMAVDRSALRAMRCAAASGPDLAATAALFEPVWLDT
eukprot:m51a1_g2535 hypothetical protein (257) ;mRNA; f:252940-253766